MSLTPDQIAGMNWWNDMSKASRLNSLFVACRAGYPDPSPADAWNVFKLKRESK